MTKDEIYAKLVEIIKDIKGDIEVSPETALIEGAIMDSLELLNYLTQIYEFLEMEITIDQLIEHELGIVGKMADFIAKAKSQ